MSGDEDRNHVWQDLQSIDASPQDQQGVALHETDAVSGPIVTAVADLKRVNRKGKQVSSVEDLERSLGDR